MHIYVYVCTSITDQLYTATYTVGFWYRYNITRFSPCDVWKTYIFFSLHVSRSEQNFQIHMILTPKVMSEQNFQREPKPVACALMKIA